MDWKDLLRKLGINPTQLPWRRALERDLETGRKRVETRAEQLKYRNKACGACGTLLDHDDLYCPRCSTRAPSWREEVARKVGAGAESSRYSVTTWIMLVIMVNEVLSLVHGEGVLWPGTPEQMDLLRSHGAMVSAFVREAGEGWRMISTGYLHIGLLHLAFNAYALWQLGNLVEREVGAARFFTIYTLSLLGGSGMDLLFSSHVSAGASGLFGLVGFGVTYAHLSGSVATRNTCLLYVFFGIIYAFVLPVDNYANLGGVLSGLVLGGVVFGEGGWHARLDRVWLIASRVCLVLTVLSLGCMLRNLLTSGWLGRAEAALQDNNYERAVALSQRVLYVDPFNSMAVAFRAEAHLGSGDYAAAVDDANRLIWLNHEDSRGYLLRAHSQFLLEHYSQAADDARSALQWGAGSADTYALLGDADVKIGQYDAAAEAYTRGLGVGGDPVAGEFYYKRGNAEYLANRPMRAQVDWGTASMYGSSAARTNLARLRRPAYHAVAVSQQPGPAGAYCVERPG